ncbi:MAG: oligosaccharide flippase family protein [Planctomycetota bacterium]|jgi:O-antigen/teichoic acid export membrane protein
MTEGIRRDVVIATASQLLQKLLGYVVLMMLARHLATDQMGAFFFCTAVSYFCAMFTDLGLNPLTIREIAKQPRKARLYLSEVLAIRLPLLCSLLGVLNGVIYFGERELFVVMALTSSYVFLEYLYYSFAAVLQGLRWVGYRAVTGLIAPVLLVLVVGEAAESDRSFSTILAGYVVANGIMVGCTVALIWRRLGVVFPVWDARAARRLLRASAPLFLLQLLDLVHFKVDTVMVGLLRTYDEVAIYEAAYKFLEASRVIIRPAAVILFPVFTALAVQRQWRVLSRRAHQAMGSAVLVGLAVAPVVAFFADPLVPAVFGSKYDESIPVLRILFLTTPGLYGAFVMIYLAQALHREAAAIRILIMIVLINIALNAIVIPAWGAVGAAWATVTTQSLLALVLVPVVRSAIREGSAKPPGEGAGLDSEERDLISAAPASTPEP